MRRFVLLAFVLLLFTTIVSPSAQGSLLTLSTHASNDGSAIDPNLLDATLNFSVLDSTLTLTVTNLTPDLEILDAPALNIDEIYFNGKENITSLVLTGVSEGNISKWVWNFLQGGSDGDGNPHQVDNFGKFDMYVKDETGKPDTYIGSGISLTFIFEINGGVGSYSADDFIELSTQVDEHTIAYAAAKFYDGVDVSGYGATNVPEPTTLVLLGLGGLLLRRRKL